MEGTAEIQGIRPETPPEEMTMLPIPEAAVVATIPTTGRALQTLIGIQPIPGRIPLEEAPIPILGLPREVVEARIRDLQAAPLGVVAVREVQAVEAVAEDNC